MIANGGTNCHMLPVLIWGCSAEADETSGRAAGKKLISGVSWERTELKPKAKDCMKAFTLLENMSCSPHREEWSFMFVCHCCG